MQLFTVLAILYASILYMVAVQIFECIQNHGKFPMYTATAVVTVLTFLTHYVTEKLTALYNLDRPDSAWFATFRTISLVARMFLLMYVGHCIVMHFHVSYVFVYRDTLLLVGMGYLLYVIFA